MANPVVLVDGSSYLFRAFNALPPLTTSKGQHTNAIRGVISMIRKLQKDYAESDVIVVFDAKGKSFRNDLYSDYKANRPPMPDELREQIAPIHQIIKAMGLPLLVIDDVEADDVIGTLAAQAVRNDIEVIISTGDKDMAQLVNSHVNLIDTMKNSLMDEQSVQEKFGVPPKHIVDYLALMGDKSDNIPGVPGIGEVKAVALINGLGTVEDIFAHLDDIAALDFRGAKNLAEKIKEHHDSALLSKQLATIKCDVALPFALDEIKPRPIKNDELLAIFTELEFKGWVAELQEQLGPKDPEKSEKNNANQDVNYQIILTENELDKLLKELTEAELFAFDTETTSLNYKDAELVGFSVATKPFSAAYVPLQHDYEGAPQQLKLERVLAKLQPILENPNIKKVGQHLKYDMHILANYGITLAGVAFDTMLESYVLDSVGRHDMDTLAKKYLDHDTLSFEELAGKGVKQLKFNQIELEKAGFYAAEDADITLRLHLALWEKLQQTPSLANVFSQIEMPNLSVLFEMEENGALIDCDLLHLQSSEIEQRLQQLEQQAHAVAGQEFNLASPKQLADILFEKLQLPIIKKTPKGAPSTAEEVLQQLADDGHQLPVLLIEHRGLAKLKNTYTDKLPLLVNNKTGRIHTSYQQAVAATGRLSSTDPNLQNIPARSEDGRRIREAFVAPEGYKIVAADYSQIELRIMAHLSADKSLLDAFAHGRDIHRHTAAEVFGISELEVTSNQRSAAKAINFGLIYGMSAFGLAKQIGCDRAEAQDYVNLYFERYPGVQQYMDSTRELAKQQGYVETVFGRRLYLPDINSKNFQLRQHAERTAINAPMQGTAADIIKKAMVAVAAWIKNSHFNAKMLMQVHDELVFEVQADQASQFAQEVKKIMEQAAKLSVPLVVDAKVGSNWEQAH
ncbi:MAG: DNA polymerase I [Venatoribacter sp.]